MQSYSQAFHNAISADTRDIRGYIKFNGTFVLDGAGGLISFKTTQNAMDAERFCVGSVCSAMCEASFYNEGLEGSGVSLANSYFDAYIGVVTDADNDTAEYVCCGRYYVSEITRSTATTRIVGYDIAGRLSMDYVPTVTADPDDGYLVMDVLNDIISQTGVNGSTPFTTYGDSTYVPNIYEGNCRAQWGWLCSLVDGTASNYSGTREPADLGYIKTYVAGNGVANPYAVDETTTYMDGLSLGDAYTITSFTSGTTDEPIVVGNGTGLYGLNPYMTTAVATTIEGTMDGYQYYPATLHWRGDPCLDILDEINVTKGTDTFKIVVMKIETTFNGGLEQTITSYGDSDAYYALSTSPTQGAINRVSSLVQEIQQAIETADGGVITKILDTDGTWKELVIANNQDLSQATSVWRFNINGLAHSNRYQGGTYTLAMDTQGRIVANVIQTGILQDAQGNNSWNLDTGALTITNGSINVTTASETYDVIQLNSGTWHNIMSPLEVGTWNDTTKHKTLIQAGGFYGYENYDGNGNEIRRFALSPGSGTLSLYETGTGILRQTINGNGVLWQYDTNGNIRTYIEYGDIYLRDAAGNNRHHLDSAGKLTQYDPNGKKRTYLEYGDMFMYTAAEKKTVHLSASAYTTGGSLRLYDTSEVERLREAVDGISIFNSSGTEQTKIRTSAGCSWYQGRYYASLQNKLCNNTSSFFPALSAKAYSSDWAIGTLNNDLYFINTTDYAYNQGQNRYLQYKLEYADTTNAAQSYTILTTKNTIDHVIQEGTTSGWTYRKWSSGVYECWKRFEISMALNSGWGSWYYGTVPRQSYPVTFTAAPREIAHYTGGSGWAVLCGGAALQSQTQTAQYYLVRPTSAGTGTYYFEFYVRGTV